METMIMIFLELKTKLSQQMECIIFALLKFYNIFLHPISLNQLYKSSCSQIAVLRTFSD